PGGAFFTFIIAPGNRKEKDSICEKKRPYFFYFGPPLPGGGEKYAAICVKNLANTAKNGIIKLVRHRPIASKNRKEYQYELFR
ncbi:MAG: hypothetical protein ACLUUJ_04485, partial [Acutalibacteraceae bacterium]